MGKGYKGRGAKLSEAEIAAIREARAQKRADDDAVADDVETTDATLNFVFASHVIQIQEDWSGEGSGLAGMQWLGGVTLARYFDDARHFPASWFVGKRVVEVGAGIGLTSILLALLGADVVLTDMDVTKALPNVDAMASPTARARVTIAELDWFAPQVERFQGQPIDVVVAGDCCYQPAVIAPLLQTLWALSRAETAVFLCGIVSDLALSAFNLHVNRFFDVEIVDEAQPPAAAPPLNADPPNTRHRKLMRLHRKSAVGPAPPEAALTDEQFAASLAQGGNKMTPPPPPALAAAQGP
jgi:predicted nicotinamide N-methyase